jgi:hypothetical protein
VPDRVLDQVPELETWCVLPNSRSYFFPFICILIARVSLDAFHISFFSTCILISCLVYKFFKIAKILFSRLVLIFGFDVYGRRVIEPPYILQCFVSM